MGIDFAPFFYYPIKICNYSDVLYFFLAKRQGYSDGNPCSGFILSNA
jgi:hypothetical protein